MRAAYQRSYFAPALFSLIPVAARCGSTIGFPAIFGVATALPVVVFAAIIAYSAKSVGKAFNRMEQIERWLAEMAPTRAPHTALVGIFSRPRERARVLPAEAAAI